VIGPAELANCFDAHAATLILFARQWLEQSAAQDVVQDAFVRLMSQARRPDNVKAWLYRTVRNAAISCARSSARRMRREMRLAEERSEYFEPQPGDLIDASAAQEALQSLPGEQREIIVMRLWAQMTLAEISQITGDAVSTLFARYRAGLAEIKRIMESSCHTKKKN
jgi:RNA polymerase sigma-70 factor (ECF subfamily)